MNLYCISRGTAEFHTISVLQRYKGVLLVMHIVIENMKNHMSASVTYVMCVYIGK